MAIPEDHLAKFHKMTDAKEMWEAIKSRFGRNDESKKMQKYLLKQQFKSFYVSNSEGLYKGYDMFQSILSQLETHDVGVSTKDANQKFLRSLPSSWSQISLIMRTEPRVDTFNFDDLYNNIRVFESDVKGSTRSSSSTKNVAFVSSDNTSSTNEVNTAFGVSTSFGHNSQKEGSTLYMDGLMNQDSRMRDAGNTGYKAMDNGKRSTKKDEHKSMVTIDGEGIDWTGHAEDDTEDYALIAFNFSNSGSDIEDNPQQTLNGKGIVDSGSSRHMTGNKACLIDYQDFNGGLVAFGADSHIHSLEDIYEVSRDMIFISASYDDEGAVADFTNLATTMNVSPIPTSRIYSIHPTTQILGDPTSAVQTRSKVNKSSRAYAFILVDLPFGKKAIGTNIIYNNKKDERGVVVRNKARLVAQGHRQEEGIDYDEVFTPVARIKAIGIFLAFAFYMRFIVYQMNMKSAFLYGKINEEVAKWFRRGLIDKTLFIKKEKKDIMLEIYNMRFSISWQETHFMAVKKADNCSYFNYRGRLCCYCKLLWTSIVDSESNKLILLCLVCATQRCFRMVILLRLGKKMQFELVLGALNGDQPLVTESSSIHDTTQDPRDSLDLEGTNGSEGDQVQSPHDSPLLGGHTSYRFEGALNLEELFSICTNLSNRVLALETIKDAQAVEIIALKARIKKLEKNYKPKEPMNEGRLSEETKELVSTARPEDSTVRPDDEKAKEKGVSIIDIEYSLRPARSILILKPLPTIDPKDKGKEIQGLYERQKRVTDDFKPMDLDDAVDKEKVLEELDSTKIEIVPDEKGEVDYEVLNKRFPIINWESKFYHLDRHGAECIYYKIFRSDGSSRWIKTFSEMVPRFDRMDLEKLYNLVMQRFETTSPEDVDLVLWGDIMTMFEETSDDDL
uniref:Ribonuclease H-like domain-containing protein n=1 Tax=Tanacetum cinerariifolium TaxID=118510 RepID=A0A6L2N5H3_TANCI|nr:ribonuclease H-like domain-containing protein [Tanacetum cinerariifolium]